LLIGLIGRPGQRQQIVLALSGLEREHEREHERELHRLGSDRHERGDLLLLPDLLRAIGVITATSGCRRDAMAA